MSKKLNDSFTDEELNDVLGHLGGVSGDLNKLMQECYEDLMFIGGAVKTKSEQTQDVFFFNLRLCIRHYSNVEDYKKLGELIKLGNVLKDYSKIEIDDNLLNNFTVNLN